MQRHWSQDVAKLLKVHRISTVATVPDGGLIELLRLCEDDAEIRVVTLGSEEEGVGLMFGLWLGGGRGALFMQSSGTGNCINALSLAAVTGAPCLMLVTMRGEAGEQNPWQVPMGQGALAALEAMGACCFPAETAAEVGPRFAQAAEHTFAGGGAAAVLVRQKVIGTKEFTE